MDASSVLEVDINGEEVFLVDKDMLASFSGKIFELVRKFNHINKKTKMIFNDFPGGAEGFELMVRFCYNGGKTEITPTTAILLNCAAHFMEMNNEVCGTSNLIEITEKSLEGIDFWSWPDLLLALRLYQDLLPTENSSSLLHKVLDSVVERLSLPGFSSLFTCSSSDKLSFLSSSDTRSSNFSSTRYSCLNPSWWFEDLQFLNTDFVQMIITKMVSQNLDHFTLGKFLVFYQKAKFFGAPPAEKRVIAEAVINLMRLLDPTALSCKCLFFIFNATSSLKLSKHLRNKMVNMVGSRLDQATVDYLLVRPPHKKGYAYNVKLVQRLVNSFLLEEKCSRSLMRLKRVASLIDSYLIEVAPDPHLRPAKFAKLVRMLPDCARESHNEMYRSIDLYLEVHTGLGEEEKITICSVLNYEKLSPEALKHLARNKNFPPKMAVQAFINRYSMVKTLHKQPQHLIKFCDYKADTKVSGQKQRSTEVILYANQLFLPDDAEEINESKLEEMQWSMKESEKTCISTMRTQMGRATKTRFFLPKLCSEL